MFVFPLFEVFGSIHTKSEHIEISFMKFLPYQLIGDELLPAERGERQGTSPPETSAKLGYMIRRRQGMSVLGLLRKDLSKRKLFMARKSTANMSPCCSLPPKHDVIKNLADAKTFMPSELSSTLHSSAPSLVEIHPVT